MDIHTTIFSTLDPDATTTEPKAVVLQRPQPRLWVAEGKIRLHVSAGQLRRLIVAVAGRIDDYECIDEEEDTATDKRLLDLLEAIADDRGVKP